jgi:hypothetical protein
MLCGFEYEDNRELICSWMHKNEGNREGLRFVVLNVRKIVN